MTYEQLKSMPEFKSWVKSLRKADEINKVKVTDDVLKVLETVAYLMYDEGFQVAQAAERGIIKVQDKINELEQDAAPVPPSAHPTPGPSPLQDEICGGIKP